MVCTVLDTSCQAPSRIPLFLPFILFRDVVFSLWPFNFLKQASLSLRLTPWVQKYGLLHQLPFLYCDAPVFLVSWPNSLLFRVLIYSLIFLIVFCIITIAASLVAILLAYYATCITRFMLASLRLVTAALYSAVSWPRFTKASSIPTRLLAPYLPWHRVWCCYWKSSWDSIKCAW